MRDDLRNDPNAWRAEPSCCVTAAVIGGSALASAGIGALASTSAANTQANAEKSAANTMEQQYQQTRSDLLPYNTAGQSATGSLEATPAFSFSPTEAQLQATPGYQFTLDQGLKSVQNSNAARGLGVSGAAEKGAAAYATGLADTTYQNQFQNALNSYQTNVSKLQNLANTGENAAAQTGAFGTTTAGDIGSTAVGAANATAAGTVGAANAISGGINGLSSAYLTNQFLGGGGAGIYGGGATTVPSSDVLGANGY